MGGKTGCQSDRHLCSPNLETPLYPHMFLDCGRKLEDLCPQKHRENMQTRKAQPGVEPGPVCFGSGSNHHTLKLCCTDRMAHLSRFWHWFVHRNKCFLLSNKWSFLSELQAFCGQTIMCCFVSYCSEKRPKTTSKCRLTDGGKMRRTLKENKTKWVFSCCFFAQNGLQKTHLTNHADTATVHVLITCQIIREIIIFLLQRWENADSPVYSILVKFD